ncbi:hypothetical protein [Caulobacter sp. RHG1]|uniref:hypothetical protein n=1 Tax=Caulobacter sp. (strain RHG1) TaxID=2545762 RepID=UPI001553807A|nr:hypothetical protein [Caulobacter sp. RHG1]NQE63065.1 hypothetical protein [Caulobacter sp. RHG1]
MATRIHLVPNGASGAPSAPPTNPRRFNYDRPLVIGAALVLWAAILVVLKLLPI